MEPAWAVRRRNYLKSTLYRVRKSIQGPCLEFTKERLHLRPKFFNWIYRKALCQFLYADALIVSFQNRLSSFVVQHSTHLLCLCYTSFCSKVKVLCCIIENCYSTAAARCKGSEIALFSVLKVVSVRSQCFARRCGCTAGGWWKPRCGSDRRAAKHPEQSVLFRRPGLR